MIAISKKLHRFMPALRPAGKKYGRNTSGVAAIEMAFIFPVMITLFFGLVDLTEGLSANRKVTLTANTLGDLVTQEDGTIDKATMDGIFDGSIEIMRPFDATQVGLEFYTFTKDSDDNVVLGWSYKKTGGPSCGAAPAPNAEMEQLMAGGNDIVVSRACFNFKYILGKFFANDHIFMKEEITIRPRQSLQLTCTDCP